MCKGKIIVGFRKLVHHVEAKVEVRVDDEVVDIKVVVTKVVVDIVLVEKDINFYNDDIVIVDLNIENKVVKNTNVWANQNKKNVKAKIIYNNF